MEKQKKFYCTFGFGQLHAGYVLPLIAVSENQARRYMVEAFNGQWCGTYSEEYWNEMKNDPNRMWPMEKELPTLDVSGYNLCDIIQNNIRKYNDQPTYR